MSVELAAPLLHENEEVLGVPAGTGLKESALGRLAALKNHPGYWVGNGKIQEWRIKGLCQQEGQTYLYGSYPGGFCLEEALDQPSKLGIPRLLELVDALLVLKDRDLPLFPLQTDAVFFPPEGGLLFLPPELMKGVREMRPLEYRLRVYARINHPDPGEVERGISFSLGCLLYRLLAGELPFEADSEEEIRQRMRQLRPTPLAAFHPGWNDELSGTVLAALDVNPENRPSLPEWRELLQKWIRAGLPEAAARLNAEQGRRNARVLKRKNLESFRRGVYWQKHWKLYALAAAGLVVLLSVAGSILGNILKPRSTSGLSPQEVARAFYESINSLDHAAMEDCVVDGAGKDLINEVIQLFVISRVAQGYEGKSHLISPSRWEQMGRPNLVPPQAVYGIAGLTLEELQGAPQPVFRASYVKYVPTPQEEKETAPASPQALKIQEKLYLRRDRQDWVIFRIERLTTP